MKIADSAVFLSTQQSYQETYRKSESLTVWDNRPNGLALGLNRQERLPESNGAGFLNSASKVDLSQAGRKVRHHHGEITPLSDDEKDIADLNLRIFAMLVERLTGRKIDLTVPMETESADGDMAVAQLPEATVPETAQGSLQGFGLAYDYHESYSETETMSFSAAGVIRTEDGREIDFTAQLNMSRQFMVEKSISIRAGDALKDPLVVNFSGAAAELGERNFVFDIDSDGTSDQISFIGPHSGFLALDRNGDGAINNGLELFGPSTGSGFAELAAYDLDGNGWIDENDDIYDRLRIWTRSADGREQLFALGEKGVGAIYLNHLATPFSIKDGSNEMLGQVRDSSIFLGDNGSVGTIQQIDLVV